MISNRRIPARGVAVALLLSLVLGACEFWRGPDPTEGSVGSPSGPFPVATMSVPSSAGFGGGTIYYPNDLVGPFAVISISPGFLGNQTSIQEWGPRLASNGFVTITINTTGGSIFPAQRSTEQRQALDHVVAQSDDPSSPIHGIVDGERRGVAGHSMGGGASLISAASDPEIDAAVPFAPWNTSSDFSDLSTPALVFACENDSIAPVASHASPMYESIPSSTAKLYMSVAGEEHFCANAPSGADGLAGAHAVAFFKLWLDEDSRYRPWLCGDHQPDTGTELDDVRSSCPF